jgi:ubiquinone biosynthesis monooxygenase Coq6
MEAGTAIATMVENRNTISALLTRLKDFPQLKILDNTSIEEITHGPETDKFDLTGWPMLHLPSGPIAARLLVGADGPNSLVRKFAKIESRGWSYDRMGVVATLKCDPSWIVPTAWQRFLPTGPIAKLPVLSFPTVAYRRCLMSMLL